MSKIDRITLITIKGQKKKILKSVRCRYLAKSHVVKCSAENQEFEYVNFRGSIFKKVKFKNCKIYGCDFLGTVFNECDFTGAEIDGCIFMACKFKNCVFTDTTIKFSTIVNTSLAQCQNITLHEKTKVYNSYPKAKLTDELVHALNKLKTNEKLRLYKLLQISDKKYNELNLYLLQRRFSNKLMPMLLLGLDNRSNKNITTYKRLEKQLKDIEKRSTI